MQLSRRDIAAEQAGEQAVIKQLRRRGAGSDKAAAQAGTEAGGEQAAMSRRRQTGGDSSWRWNGEKGITSKWLSIESSLQQKQRASSFPIFTGSAVLVDNPRPTSALARFEKVGGFR